MLAVLAQSLADMTAHVVAGLAGRWRSIDCDRCYAPISMRRSLVHSTDTSARLGLRNSFWGVFVYKKMLGRTQTRTRDRMDRQSMRTV